jgi:hypothetical protein
MIKLQTQFVSGEGGYSSNPLTYTQVIRNDTYAVYERSLDGRVKDYETFVIVIKKKGHNCFGTIAQEDTEEYTSTGKFGKKAWSFKNKTAALNKFNELTAKNIIDDTDEDDDKKSIVIPRENFTMKNLVGLNTEYTQPVLYIEIQNLIKSNKVKVVGHQKSESGRGKPQVIYSLV